ncbi:biliverdin-producing heme oxygenase [Sphingomonas sp. HDW15A]|uniref:biliverdin-producing heme oxygenase n=1 Tax=Sphingomonas sp. HDW15A TaxID=2714942 RepID=UPI00140DF398|nr:biliverdin-producing heme oxygenase [Sphingomonas sp. HDW15A]QIK96335.1 biliverdin-producing heme oxygenase [Sphingomonas sp. HDW15A]
MSAHLQLRAATRAAHDRVDAYFAGFDLADQRQYGEFLLAHAAAFLPAEQAIADAGGSNLPGFHQHRRSAALRQDLANLGLDSPSTGSIPPLRSFPEVLGGAYVLEGSRLGGAVLARQVAAGLPRRFLAAPTPAGHWRAFIAYLDAQLDDDLAIASAIRSALEMFALFESTATSVRA